MPAAPMFAAPALATPSQPAPPTAVAAKPAVEPPQPAVVRGKALAAEGALNLSGSDTYTGGTMISNSGLATASPVNAKHGSADVVAKDADRANDRVAKGRETTQLMNGNFAAPSGSMSAAGQVTVPTAKSGPALQFGFADGQATSETYVLNVSKLAVQNRVFENLLALQGLGNNQNSTNMAQNAVADKSSRRSGQAEQAAQGRGQGQTRQRSLSDNRSTGTESIYYEFDASPQQLAILIKQISERSDFFSTPKIEPSVTASSQARSFVQNRAYPANNPLGGFGGRGGGMPAAGPGQQQPGMALGGRANLRPQEVPQPQADQLAASGAAQLAASPAVPPVADVGKQRVVFVLNVVDHWAPPARPSSQLPAAAAPAPK
jgi:hypothetical protein